MTFCNLRFKMTRLLNMAIKIEAARSRVEDKGFSMSALGDITKLQEKVSLYNAIHKLFIQAI